MSAENCQSIGCFRKGTYSPHNTDQLHKGDSSRTLLWRAAEAVANPNSAPPKGNNAVSKSSSVNAISFFQLLDGVFTLIRHAADIILE